MYTTELSRVSTVYVDDEHGEEQEYEVEWTQDVAISRGMYGQDADGNRGEYREEIDEAVVLSVDKIDPKPMTAEIGRSIRREIEEINEDHQATWDAFNKSVKP